MQFLIVYISIPCVEEGQKGRLLAGRELLWWWYVPVLMQNSVLDGCACASVVSLLELECKLHTFLVEYFLQKVHDEVTTYVLAEIIIRSGHLVKLIWFQ